MNKNVGNPNVNSSNLSFRARLTEEIDKKWNALKDKAMSWFEEEYKAAALATFDYVDNLDDSSLLSFGNALEFEFHLVGALLAGRGVVYFSVLGPSKERLYRSDSRDADFSLNFKSSAKVGDEVEERLFRLMDEFLAKELETTAGATYEASPLNCGDAIVVDKVVKVPYTFPD